MREVEKPVLRKAEYESRTRTYNTDTFNRKVPLECIYTVLSYMSKYV